MPLEHRLVGRARILPALIAMMDQPRFHSALEQCHVQCVEHQLLINPFTHRRRRLVNERVRVVNNLEGIPP